MEHIYIAYKKTVQNTQYYFVKKIMTFPEYTGLAEVLVGYGMHINFEKACSIAGIRDTVIKAKLLQDAEGETLIQKALSAAETDNGENILRRLADQATVSMN